MLLKITFSPRNMRPAIRRGMVVPLACLSLCALGRPAARASSTASDNAGNYDTSGTVATGFTTGSNQGTGFQPFLLTATSQAGYFLQQNSPDSQVNSSGKVFDQYGYGDNTDPNVGITTATRPFTGALSIGQSFSISLDSRGTQNNSTVGISLSDSSGNARFTLDFLGGTNQLRVTDAGGTRNANNSGTNVNFATLAGGINVVFTLTGANSYTVTATGISDATRFDATSGTLAGTAGSGVDRVRIFDNNAGNDNDFFFNNLAVTGVPEPGTLAGAGLTVLAGMLAWRRKHRAIRRESIG